MQPHSHNNIAPDQARQGHQSQHHHPYQQRPTSSSSAVGSTSSANRPRTANSVSPANSSDRPPKPPRKLNRSANQLHRNQACLPCRRRRIKCDAAKPHCSSCIRSFRFLARTQPDPEREARGVQCVYEESADNEPIGGGGVEGLVQPALHVDPEHPRNTVLKLEGRIAELQDALARLSDGQQTIGGASISAPASATFPPVHSSSHQHHPLSAGAHSVPRSMSWSVDSNVPGGAGAGGAVGGGATGSAFSPQQYSPAQSSLGTRFSFDGGAGTGVNAALGAGMVSSTPLSSSPIQEHSTASHRYIHPNQTGVGHHHSMSGHSQVLDMGMGGMGHLHHSLQGSRSSGPLLSDCGYSTNGLSSAAIPPYHHDLGNDDDGSRGTSAGGGQYLDVFRQGWQPYLAEPSLIDHFVQTFMTAPSLPPTPTQETLLNHGFPPTRLSSASPTAQLAPTFTALSW